MTLLMADFGGGRSTMMELGERIGSGAVGDVHWLEGRPGLVAKLYRTPADRAAYERKIADMIRDPPDLPPLEENGQEYVQIAWPMAALHETTGGFVGFVMPEIDMTAATELENVLQKVSRRVRKLPEFYGGRALLAANLAAVMAELHRHGHYFIDMKPVNIRFYPASWYLAILDTDGFSVQGVTRWPARQFSEEYIAPEARNQAPAVLGVEQDLFALAVIIFQLLNNGLHPYQGLDARPDLPSTLQERIFEGLYAYGRTPPADVRPAPATIHESFEDSTRDLFDRAFGDAPAARPTAEEWKTHLQGLITSGVLRKCSRRPDEHMHFSRACGLCALDARRAAAAPAPPPPTPNVQFGGATVGAPLYQAHAQMVAPPPPPPPPPPPKPSPSNAATLGRVFAGSVAHSPRQVHAPPPESNVRTWIVVGALAALVLGAALFSPNPSKDTSSAPPPSRDSPRAPTAMQQAAAAKMDDETLCRTALSTNVNGAPLSEATWETRAPYVAHVAEAQRRGLAIQSCRALLQRSPGKQTATTNRLDQSPLADVCRDALAQTVTATSNPAEAKWDDRPYFAAYVQEARRRGQTPEACTLALRTKPPATSPQLEQLSLAEVCRVALASTVTMSSNPAQATWDDRPFVATYVAEARRRNQTPRSCAMALRKPSEELLPDPPARVLPPDPALSAICRFALDSSIDTTSDPLQARWNDRSVFSGYVQEALRRGQTPESCAMAIR